MDRAVFFISDHTGITAEALGRSLLSQFPDFRFERTTLPFVDTEAKLRAACQRIQASQRDSGQAPLVFSSLANAGLRTLLMASGAVVFDVFEGHIERLETALGLQSAQAVGRAHGFHAQGRERIEALKFALDTDDGLRADAYGAADIILVGVSRSGKTPACLYLSLQYGVAAANYPLAEEELERVELPRTLRAWRDKLFGLTLVPERLHLLREERRPGSRYASLPQCRREIQAAAALFQTAGIPCLDTSNMSVEEIATTVLHRSALKRLRW